MALHRADGGDWRVTVTPTGDADPLVYVFAGNSCGPTCASETFDVGGAGEEESLDLGVLGAGQSVSIVVDSFLAAVRARRAPEVTGVDGYRALELAERIAAEIRAQAW